MDLKDIKAIIDLMKKNSISEFEMEREGFKIKMKRGSNGVASQGHGEDYAGGNSAAVPMLPLTVLPPSGGNPTPQSLEQEISSPMIGTFYRAPSPESSPYVDIGSEVGPDTVVCIIEAMKVMNEIKAEARGVVTQVVMKNAKPVEFGQALFKIRPL